jgi:Fe2+ transport system protein FeoA
MAHSTSIPLASVKPEQLVEVASVDAATDDSARLKAMGVCVGRKVQIIKQGDPLIVRVVGTRIGLSARLAQMVTVCPLTVPFAG